MCQKYCFHYCENKKWSRVELPAETMRISQSEQRLGVALAFSSVVQRAEEGLNCVLCFYYLPLLS